MNGPTIREKIEFYGLTAKKQSEKTSIFTPRKRGGGGRPEKLKTLDLDEKNGQESSAAPASFAAHATFKKLANENPGRTLTAAVNTTSTSLLSRMRQIEDDYRKEKEMKGEKSGKKRGRRGSGDEKLQEKCPRIVKMAKFDHSRAGFGKLNHVGLNSVVNETQDRPSIVQKSQLYADVPHSSPTSSIVKN